MKKKRGSLAGFALRVWVKSMQDQVGAYAAQSAFFILLSAIPFLILFLQIIRVLPYTRSDLIYALQSVVPEYMMSTIESVINELYSQSFGVLGITVLAAYWASSKAMHSITFGLESIYGAEEIRNWFAIRFWALLYTAVMEIGLIFLLAITVFWKNIQKHFLRRFLDDNAKIYMFNSGSKWIFILVVMILMFALMYKIFPNQRLRYVDQLPGAAFAAIGWFITSMLIMFYVNYFNGFSMYGSLSTLVLLMFWLYVCMYLLMVGAEVNEEIRRGK